MLFLGLTHGLEDSRLNRFLAAEIERAYPDVTCLYLGKDSGATTGKKSASMTPIAMPSGINLRKRRFRFDDAAIVGRYIQDMNIDLVQVSDVRELPLACWLKQHTSIPVIFDSHEDYFNQSWEYGQKSFKGLFHGVFARSLELLAVRYADAVFCTDPFLESFYRHPLFHAPKVTMVRNIPPAEAIHDRPVFHDRQALKLIYVGSVNRLRGLLETAAYCARFNGESASERQGVTLSFRVCANPHPVIDQLVSDNLIEYLGFRVGRALTQAVRESDAGVSLILPTVKFERNILIKNFEYMAAGLPILTSNYGTMKQYVEAASAGVLCDPLDYWSFKSAILELRDPALRQRLGKNGLAWAKANFNRAAEVRPYVETVGRLLRIDTP